MVNQRLALLFPPTWDPCEPYLALPALAAYMRERGVLTLSTDENCAFFRHVLSRDYLEGIVAGRLEQRAAAGIPAAATHLEHLPETIVRAEKACTVFSEPDSFFNLERFSEARSDVAMAMAAASSAWAPTRFDFYRFEMRYPFSSSRALLDAAGDEDENPFIDFFRRETLPRLASFQPTVAGISVSSVKQLIGAFTLARQIRETMPEVFILVGGNAFTRYPEKLRTDSRFYRWVDGYVVGEGEIPLAALLEALEAGGGLDDVPALSWRTDWSDRSEEPSAHVLRQNGPADPVDLDTLPTPDFQGLLPGAYFSPLPVLPVETSRGCVWGRCTFCSHHLVGGKFRMRNPELVLEDIRILEQRHGARHFTFVDNAVPVRTLRRVSEGLLDGGPDIHWSGYVRFSRHFNPKFCRLLADAGCCSLWFGLESANQRVLDRMDKGTTVELARQVSRNCFDAGLAVDFFCMIGFPTEMPAEALETFAFLADLEKEITGTNGLFAFESFALDTCSKLMAEPENYSIRLLDPRKPGNGGNGYDHDISPVVAYIPEQGLTIPQVARLMEGFQLRLERMFGHLPIGLEDREANALLHRSRPDFRRRLDHWRQSPSLGGQASRSAPSPDNQP